MQIHTPFSFAERGGGFQWSAGNVRCMQGMRGYGLIPRAIPTPPTGKNGLRD
jgi:hypothetical protein